MASSNFKLDGNTPTVTWADPKSAPITLLHLSFDG
ncbi:Ubiquitin carboxyl-terminal hydrolase [Psidium guajava]|nr:Ubiquitin carboxyl-terminal hydrolase [Psidium guajava]